MVNLRAIALTLFVLTAHAAAFAEDGFDCLRKLKGGSVRWDMDWQRDRSDNDVRYRVQSITESQVNRNLREVAIELLAEEPAKVAKRVSRIRMDHAAEMFCSRAQPAVSRDIQFVRVRSMIVTPDRDSTVVAAYNPKDLPFRISVDGQWKAARMPATETVKVCATNTGVFSCTASDYARLSSTGVNMDLAGRGKLPQPFIQFRDGGWVRSAEADLPRLGKVAECSLFGRKFSCLEEEKNAYGVLLKQLEGRKG